MLLLGIPWHSEGPVVFWAEPNLVRALALSNKTAVSRLQQTNQSWVEI